MRAFEATAIAARVEVDLEREFALIREAAERGAYCVNLGPITEQTADSLRALGYRVSRNWPCGPENFLASWPFPYSFYSQRNDK